MSYYRLLIEGRIDDFRKKYEDKFDETQLDKIVVSISDKYLNWVGKNISADNFDKDFKLVGELLSQFDKVSQNLQVKDINGYKNISELQTAIQEYSKRKRRDYKEVEGGVVVFDDGRYFVVNPKTHKSSCYYGKGTKWCTAADSNYHFERYNDDGKLFYILDRNADTSDQYYKIALLNKFDGDKTFFDAKDNQTSIIPAVLGKEKYDEIIQNIQRYMMDEYSNEIKIFSDKAKAKQEYERIQRLRQLRILNQKRSQAEERRENNEWELGPNCPDVGLKAHALFDVLEYNNEIERRTDEDNQRLSELKQRLESLQAQETEIESQGGDTEDILEQISTVEDEIQKIENKVDVYNIVQTGSLYNMTQFEIIDAGLDNHSFAVGTEEETRDSAIEAMTQLVDDVGYEGFNSNFVKRFIDSDEVAEYAREVYNDWVYQEPENYLDEEDKELSEEQKEEIRYIKDKIAKLTEQISRLEGMKSQEDAAQIDKKIEDLEELIGDLDYKIEEIEANPDGDYSEDKIEEKIDELVSGVRRNPEYFISELDLDYKNFIDKDKFVEAVVDEDGYGHTLNVYDGTSDETKVMGVWYYVMTIDR